MIRVFFVNSIKYFSLNLAKVFYNYLITKIQRLHNMKLIYPTEKDINLIWIFDMSSVTNLNMYKSYYGRSRY